MTDEPKPVGRPRTIGGVKIAVTLGAEDVAYLATFGSNRSAALRRVIREHREARLVLDLIDKHAGPADRTCDEPGIRLSEAARRELADMGKIDYKWREQKQEVGE